MSDIAASARSGILAIDEPGGVFGLLCSLNLEAPLQRVDNPERLCLDDVGLAVVAVYGRPDWEIVVELTERVRTVVVTTFPNHDDAMRAVATGTHGYLDTSLPRDALRRSIVGVMQGELAHSRRLLAELIRSGRWIRGADTLPLTPRQRQVVALIAEGAGDKEIACSLGISTATAQKHVTNVLKRLNVPNRAAAVAAMSAPHPYGFSTAPHALRAYAIGQR